MPSPSTRGRGRPGTGGRAGLALVAFLAGWTAAATGLAAGLREDLYFRESLNAIRDWEALLALPEGELPTAERTPAFPVPANGDTVAWPNPVPLRLQVGGDPVPRLRLRLVDGRADVRTADGGPGPAAEPGKAVALYHHPGGGGKDHWYHAYSRRFDALSAPRLEPAPFSLELPASLDLGRGANRLTPEVRNVTPAPLTVSLQLRLLVPDRAPVVLERRVDLGPGARQTVDLPVSLTAEGGGLLLLSVHCGERVYLVPLLTHVECVGAVLDSVALVLADAPDVAAAARLEALRGEAAAWSPAEPDAAARWQALFETASRLREDLLLARLPFQALLFVRRRPYDSEQPYMDAHHLRNPPGGSLCRLAPVRPDGTVTPVVDSLGEGIYRDLCLHWDADRLLFAFGNGSDDWKPTDQSYHLFEVRTDGRDLRQLTSGPKNDCEPFYLPGGQIGFTSDRAEHFVMCGGPRHAANLHVMEADGSGVRQLSFNVYNEFNPTLLPDGRILYSRWEYNERSVTSLHHPFTMLADGRTVSPYYGNATIRPNVTMFTRPIPDSPKVMSLFTAHHGQTHGPIGVIDRRRGVDGPTPLTLLTPGVPVTGEKAEDSRRGWFSDPWPLSETLYLCSYTPTVLPWLPRSWALYVGDRHGNLALVYRDPAISCAEPVPLARRPPPHALPPAPADTDSLAGECLVVVQDVYVGLPGVTRGTARYLRVIEDLPRKSVHPGGVITTSGTGIYTAKRILGTVPVEADGSAYAVLPANRNLYVEVLDADLCEIQRMRSVVCLKPGEARACVGCHEPRLSAPPARRPAALRRAPSRPQPPPWGDAAISYLRDVQPLLNAHCVRCHAFDRPANRVILTDDLTDRFCVGYEELLPYLTVANAMRWDHPDDVLPRPPYTYGSKVSPLTRLLAAGHQGVKLPPDDWQRLVTWIDANGVYYDRYESAYGDARSILGGPAGQALDDVFGRRCASCHDRSGNQSTWWRSLNRRDVRLSRALMAPLARQAGGWGRCEGPVFTRPEDPDYQALLAVLTGVRDRLGAKPREDLLTLHGTQAEGQVVTLPTPPPPRPATGTAPLEGDWVNVADLPWTSATAGWSVTGDLRPRLSLDAEDKALRLGGRVYRSGVGTHAPSTITYDLEARYDHLFALVGGAESGGTVVFQVFGDDRCLFDSGVLHGLREVKAVDVAVDGVRRLRLVVTDAGDGVIADMANWAAARLRRVKTTADGALPRTPPGTGPAPGPPPP